MDQRRLILIGGSAGAGKTTVARALTHSLDAGWLQIDTLWIAAQDAFKRDSDAYRLLRVDEFITNSTATVEEMVERHVEASQFVCRMLPRALRFELQTHETLVADGAWLLPEFVVSLALEGITVTSAFIYEADSDEVRAAMDSRRGVPMVAPWHERSARVSWAYGNYLTEEAHRFGLPVVTARPRESWWSAFAARSPHPLAIDTNLRAA